MSSPSRGSFCKGCAGTKPSKGKKSKVFEVLTGECSFATAGQGGRRCFCHLQQGFHRCFGEHPLSRVQQSPSAPPSSSHHSAAGALPASVQAAGVRHRLLAPNLPLLSQFGLLSSGPSCSCFLGCSLTGLWVCPAVTRGGS